MDKPIRALALVLMLASCASPSTELTPAPTPAPKPAPKPRYDPLQAFAQLDLPQPITMYRAGNGAPGPAYWQNRADYAIQAHLLPADKQLVASETITYTNNSPEALACLWLRVEQNAYEKGSRLSFSWPKLAITGGYHFDRVEVEAGGKTTTADYLISDTRMQIRLAQPLAPHGVVKLHLAYHYTIPKEGGRTGWAPSKNGDIYDVAQWYPRMAVFDDLRGWDTLPYLGNEFYLEYGDFDYSVTVPADMLVAGSGELVNPEEVLTAAQRARLDRARSSDQTVMIRSPSEVTEPASRPKQGGELTWHFRMHDTRDVVFAASRAFVWDAARIALPDHQPSALAMSFYPVESVGPQAWTRSTQYVKDALEQFSRRWYPYPWPAAIAVAGPTNGMEYPGVVFDGADEKDKVLFFLTAHEIGHSLFPMIVGSNERRDAFLDEGLNTFIDVYESKDYNRGEFAPKSDHEYAPDTGDPIADIQKVLADPKAPPIVTRADAIPYAYAHPVSYFKTALGLVLLREQILGKQRFDFAFRKYIRDWAFKHPSPSDFFREMNSAGGEDLSWFWRGWFFHNWNVDLAVTKVAYRGDPGHGATVTLANLDRLVMPAVVQIAFADGSKQRLRVPAEAWIHTTTLDVAVDGTQPITAVTIDPDHVIPDANRGNNVVKGPFAAAPAPAPAAK